MLSISDEEFDKKLWKIVDKNEIKTVRHKNKSYYISKKIIDEI